MEAHTVQHIEREDRQLIGFLNAAVPAQRL